MLKELGIERAGIERTGVEGIGIKSASVERTGRFQFFLKERPLLCTS